MGSVDVPKFVRDRMKEHIQNGKKPTESNVPSFVKKKDETVSEDSAIPAPPTSDPSQPGTEITPQSPSQLPSENGAATPKIDFREGLKFQEQPQSKKPAIFSIAELARQQNNDDNIILASVIPKTFPENQPNNIVAENTKNSKEKDVLAGNPDAITSVIQREQQKLEKQKNDAKNNLSGIQKAQGYGAQGSELYDKSVELRAEVELLRATQLQLLNDGVETINKVYAKKFEDSPDKSVIVQNALGNELRSQQAKIGGDLLYTDEKSIADRLPDYEKVMSAPGASSSPIKNVLQQRLDLVRKTNQQLEFTNRATLLNATYENSFEQLQDLSKEPEVQQGLSGTPERQAALADNPKVVQAKKLMDDFKSTGAQMDNLVNQYPEVKAQRQAQQVSDLYADYIVRAEKGEYGAIEKLAAGRNLVEGKRLNDDYEIKRIVEASKGTLTEDEVRKYADNASIPSFVGNFLRGFGTSFKDTEQGVNRLLMPKSEADIHNTLIEQSKYHAPEALQGYSNVNNIVSTMFSGTGNIVGLGVQGLAGGEIIGAVSGLSKLARLSKTALNALQTAEQVLPTTKLADFMVTLGAAETKEQALAQILGAATKAKNMAGVYGSIYLPTYEGAYQEAARFTSDEDKRNEYASDVANANGVAMLFLNPPSLVGKIIKPVPFGTKEVFKSQLEHVGKTLVSAAPATMIPLVQETISKDDIFDYHTSASTFINESLDRTLHMAVSVLPLGILGAARMQSSKMLKSSLYEAGKQREQMNERVEELFNKGEITNEEKNRQISVINTLSNLVHNTPEKNNEGKELTQEKKNDLVYLQMQNAALRAKQENVSEDIKPHYEQEIKENTSAIKEIMQPKEEKAAEATQPEVVSNEVVEKVKYGDVIKYGDENSKEATVIFINPTSVILRKSNPREIEGNEIGVPIILNEKGEVLDGNNRVKHSLDKGIKSIPAVTINRESISEKELKNLVNVLRYKYSTLNQLPAKEIMQAKEENPSEESTKEPEVTHDEDLIPDSRQSKVNELIEQVRYYNSLRKNAVNKAQSLNEIRLAANELGLNFVNKKGYGILRNEAGNRVQTRSSQTNASEAVDFKEENYSPQTKDQIKNILTDDSPLVGLPIKGEDGFRLSDRQKQAALKSIQAGKPTKGAKAIYDFIEGAVKDGNIEIEDKTTGQAVKVPVDEYFEMFKEPAKELTDEQIIELNTELGEQAFNEIFDNALNEGYENSSRRNVSEAEQANETAAGENPQTPLSGKSNEQVSSETSQENTRVTKPITINVSEEKSSQSGEESRQESGQTRQEGNEENVGSQPIAENQGGAAAGSGGPPFVESRISNINVERPATELSHRGLQNVSNEFSLSDVKTRDRKSDIQLRQDARETTEGWAEKGEYAKNVEGLIEKAESGEILTDEQRVILERHLANVTAELRAIKDKSSPEFDAKLSEIKRLKEAGEKTRSEAGAALRIGAGGSRSSPIEDYADAMVAKMEANNVDVLTEAQKAEVEKSVKVYEERAEKADEKVKLLEEKMAALEAQKELNRQGKKEKTKSKTVKKKTTADFQAERAKFKQQLSDAKKEHEEWLEEQGIQKSGFSGVTLTSKMIKAIGKIIGSHVEEFGNNLAEVTKKVFDEIKELFPGITQRDIHDIIAGEYAQKRPTQSQLQRDLKDLKDEAYYINKLEKLYKGEEPKTEKSKIERNKNIKELQDKIRAFNKEVPPDANTLKAAKKRNEDSAKKINERIANKDFDEKQKPTSVFDNAELKEKYPQLYKETLDALHKKELAKGDFDVALMKDRIAKMDKLEKFGYWGKKVIGTTKALKSGVDDSAILVQNILAMIAHPRSGAKAFRQHALDAFSEKRYNRWLTELHNNTPVWDLIKKSGLDVTEPGDLRESNREEVFSYNLLDRTKLGKYFLKPFERAFTSIGNAMRVNMFLKITNRWAEEGKTFENRPEDYKSLATLLNTETGRGDLHKNVQKASELVTAGIWSPRLMASRLNILGLSDISSPITGKGYYAGLSPRVRRMAALDVSKFIGTGLTLMAFSAMAGLGVDLDPESPTFGTIHIGKKRINVFDGFSKYVRTAAQLVSGKKKRGEVIGKFFRGSTTPAAGVSWDIITGKDYAGKPITAEGEVKNLMAPMSASGIVKDVQRDGMVGLVSGMAQFFGANVTDERDYENDRVKNIPESLKADYERTNDKGFLPPQVQPKISYHGQDIDLTDKQHDEFSDMVEAERLPLIESLVKNEAYKAASDEERKKALFKAYDKGREFAKLKFFEKHKTLIEDANKRIKDERKESEKQRKERSQ